MNRKQEFKLSIKAKISIALIVCLLVGQMPELMLRVTATGEDGGTVSGSELMPGGASSGESDDAQEQEASGGEPVAAAATGEGEPMAAVASGGEPMVAPQAREGEPDGYTSITVNEDRVIYIGDYNIYLKDGQQVTNQDTFALSLAFRLPDDAPFDETDGATYIIPLSKIDKIMNIDIRNMDPNRLTDGKGSTFQVVGDELILHFTADYLKETVGHRGAISMSAEISDSARAEEDGSLTLQFGTAVKTVQYSNKNISTVTVNKTLSNGKLPIRKEDGSWYQKFQVEVSIPWDVNGEVTLESLADVPGSFYGNEPVDFVIESTHITWPEENDVYSQFSEKEYDSLAAFNAALSGVVLPKGQTLAFTYLLPIEGDMTTLASEKNIWDPEGWSNKALVTYENSEGESKTAVGELPEYAYKPVLPEPVLKKSVNTANSSLDGDDKVISWDFEIDLSQYKKAGVVFGHDGLTEKEALAGILTEIKDTMGYGLVFGSGDSSSFELDWADFEETYPGSYIYRCTGNSKYDTAVSQEALENPKSLNLTNRFLVTLEDPIQGEITRTSYETVGYTTPGNSSHWVNKSVVDYDLDDGTITWRVDIDFIEGITEAAFLDATDCYNKVDVNGNLIGCDGKHAPEGDIYVAVGTGKDDLGAPVLAARIDGTTLTVVDEQIFRKQADTYETYYYFTGGDNYSSSLGLKFANDFITQMDQDGKRYVSITLTTKVAGNSSMDSAVFGNQTEVKFKLRDNPYATESQKAGAVWERDGNFNKKCWRVGTNEIEYAVDFDISGQKDGISAGDVIVIRDAFTDGSDAFYAITGDVYIWYGYEGETSYQWGATVPNLVWSAEDEEFRLTVTDELIQKMSDASRPLARIQISYKAVLKEEAKAQLALEGTKEGNKGKVVINNKAEGSLKRGDAKLADLGEARLPVVVTPSQLVIKDGQYNKFTNNHIYYTVDINPEALDLVAGDGRLIAEDTLGRQLSFDFRSEDDEDHALKVYRVEGGSEILLTKNQDYSYEYIDAANKTIFYLPDSTHIRITYAAKVNVFVSHNEELNGSFDSDGGGGNTIVLRGFEDVSYGKANFTVTGRAKTSNGYVESHASGAVVTLNKIDSEMGLVHGCEFELYECSFHTDPVTKVVTAIDAIPGDATPVKTFKATTGVYEIADLDYDVVYALKETKAAQGYAKNEELYYFVVRGDGGVSLGDLGKTVLVTCGDIHFTNEKEDCGELVLQKKIVGIPKSVLEAAVGDNIGILFQVTADLDPETAGPEYYENFSVYVKDFVESAGTPGEIVATVKDPEGRLKDLTPGTYYVKELCSTIPGYRLSETSFAVAVGDGEPAEKEAGDDCLETTVEGGKKTTVVVTNTYGTTGSLVIEKTVEGVGELALGDSISFTLTGDAQTGYYSSRVQVNLLWRDGGDPDGDGKLVYSLSVDHLPLGNYTLTETTGIAGYRLVSTTYDGVEADRKQLTVTAGVEQTVEVVNVYERILGSLEIIKVLAGIESNQVVVEQSGESEEDRIVIKVWGDPTNPEIQDYAETLSLKLSDFDQDASGRIDADSELSVSRRLENLIPGTYFVKETCAVLPGYTLATAGVTYNPATPVTEGAVAVTVVAEEIDADSGDDLNMAKMVITDTYNPNKGSIRLTKVLDNVSLDDLCGLSEDANIVFTITGIDGTNTAGQEYEVKLPLAKDPENLLTWTNRLEKTLSGLPEGEYVIAETVSAVPGYTLNENGTVFSETADVSANADGTATVLVKKDGTTQVTVTNTYTQDAEPEGTIVIRKQFVFGTNTELTSGQLKALSFTVQGTTARGADYEETVYLKDGMGSDADAALSENKEYSVSLTLPVGEYTITENAPGGLSFEQTVEYSTDGGVSFSTGKTVSSAEVSEGGETEVLFRNTYEEYAIPTRNVIVQKTFTGLTGEQIEAMKNDLTVTLSKGSDTRSLKLGGATDVTPAGAPTNTHVYAFDFGSVPALPAGETYTLEETGYALTGYDVATTAGGAAGTSMELAVPEAAPGEEDTPVTAQLGNAYTQQQGKLAITKLIPMDDLTAAELSELMQEISFTVTGPDGVVYGVLPLVKPAAPLGTYSTLGDGNYTITLDALPIGDYTVSETITDAHGCKVTTTYTTKVGAGAESGAAGIRADGTESVTASVEQNKTTVVQFTNTYRKPQLEVVKKIEGLTAQEVEDCLKGQLAFKLQKKEAGSWTDVANSVKKAGAGSAVLSAESDGAGHTIYTCTLSWKVPEGTYRVVESGFDPAALSDKDIKIEAGGSVVKSPEDTTVTEAVSGEIVLSADSVEPVTVTYRNIYRIHTDYGKVVLSKRVLGDATKEEAKNAVVFTVTGSDLLGDEITPETHGLTGFTEYSAADNTWTTELTLPVGTYQITETGKEISGYTLDEVTYSLNGGAEVTTAGAGPAFTVSKDAPTTLRFTDTYTKNAVPTPTPVVPTPTPKPAPTPTPTPEPAAATRPSAGSTAPPAPTPEPEKASENKPAAASTSSSSSQNQGSSPAAAGPTPVPTATTMPVPTPDPESLARNNFGLLGDGRTPRTGDESHAGGYLAGLVGGLLAMVGMLTALLRKKQK